MEDYYAILGIDSGADQDEIQTAYEFRASNWHTENGNPNAEGAEDARKKLQLIREAFKILSNPNRRAQYDLSRANPSDADSSNPVSADVANGESEGEAGPTTPQPANATQSQTGIPNTTTTRSYSENRTSLEIENLFSGIGSRFRPFRSSFSQGSRVNGRSSRFNAGFSRRGVGIRSDFARRRPRRQRLFGPGSRLYRRGPHFLRRIFSPGSRSQAGLRASAPNDDSSPPSRFQRILGSIASYFYHYSESQTFTVKDRDGNTKEIRIRKENGVKTTEVFVNGVLVSSKKDPLHILRPT